MKWVNDRDGLNHPELSTQEARQARPGRPVLYVLIGGLCGTVLGFGLAGLIG